MKIVLVTILAILMVIACAQTTAPRVTKMDLQLVWASGTETYTLNFNDGLWTKDTQEGKMVWRASPTQSYLLILFDNEITTNVSLRTSDEGLWRGDCTRLVDSVWQNGVAHGAMR